MPPRAEAEDEPPAAQELQGSAHLGEQRRVTERLAQHRMAELELRMEGSHVGERREPFEHVGIAELQVVHKPGRVEMSGDQVQSAVQVFDERGPPFLVARFAGHTKAELNACYKVNSTQRNYRTQVT
jgi:hypothetical protein